MFHAANNHDNSGNAARFTKHHDGAWRQFQRLGEVSKHSVAIEATGSHRQREGAQ